MSSKFSQAWFMWFGLFTGFHALGSTEILTVEGRIHAASHEQQLYVLTWRNPEDFFDFKNYSLIARSPELQEQFKTLVRHDKVSVKARSVAPNSAQPHLMVQELTILEKWREADENPRDWQPPENFPTSGSLTGKVHALAGEGRMLVLETESGIYPVVIGRPELTQNLYRNDIITLNYRLRSFPNRPPHLSENPDVASPIAVLDSIVAGHQIESEFNGNLILFPKSPQIQREIFAVQVVGPEGVERSHTLVPIGGQEDFDNIYSWLKDIWNSQITSATQERNWLENDAIQVTVKGKLHVVSPQQANPQIFIEKAEDLKIEIRSSPL